MHQRASMNERKLVDALIARAASDAREFRDTNPQETPTDLWIENRYTAALPLAKADTETDPGPDPHPDLFAAYRTEITRHLGEREHREDPQQQLSAMPTEGER